jgi:hypothetical protein
MSCNVIAAILNAYHIKCNKCYDGDAYNRVNNEKCYTLQERTRRTTWMFEVHRYKVIEKWECDHIHESKITQSLLTTLRHHDFFTHKFKPM